MRVREFQFPMGIRRSCYPPAMSWRGKLVTSFNSRWELDGVATRVSADRRSSYDLRFQFPMGIRRSCYVDPNGKEHRKEIGFQFPMGIRRSCYTKPRRALGPPAKKFQFPMGIRRSCYEHQHHRQAVRRACRSFNSRWELDGVATRPGHSTKPRRALFQFPMGIRRSCYLPPTSRQRHCWPGVSIPDGN